MALTANQINSIYAALFGPNNLPSQAQLNTWLALDAAQGDNAVLLDIVNSPASHQYDYAITQLIEFVQATAPTAAQLQGWVQYLIAGNPLANVVNAFAASTTFQNNFNNGQPVPNVNAAVNFNIAYNIIFNALGSIPSNSQVQAWVNTGIAINAMVAQFSQGDQYSARTAQFVQNYLVTIAAHAAGIGPAVPPGQSLFGIPALITISDNTATNVPPEQTAVGNDVVFTVKGVGVSAGTQATWSLGGTALSEVTGPTTGTLTFNAAGQATITVHTAYNNIAQGTITLSLTSVSGVTPDTVTLVAPAIQHLTPTAGETVTCGPVNTVVEGVVDTEVVFNNTLTNAIDVVNGDPNFSNTEWIVIDSTATQNGSAHKTIVPASSGVQTFEFTNNDDYGSPPEELCCDELPSDATWIDGTFMKDVTKIVSMASTHDTLIFNLQNFITDISILESDAPGALYLGVIMRDAVTSGGTQNITLQSSGEVFLEDETTSDFSVVGQFNITSHNENPDTPNILHIDGTEIATSIFVTDGSSADTTEIFSCNDTEALTTLDLTGTTGTAIVGGIEASGGNHLDIFEGTGSDTEYVAVEGTSDGGVSGSLTIHGTTVSGSGSSTTNVFLQDGGGQTIIDNQPNNNNDTLNVNVGGSEFAAGDSDGCEVSDVSNDCPDNVTITATMGNGNDAVNIASLMNPLGANAVIKVTLGTGTNTVTSYSGDKSSVTIASGLAVGGNPPGTNNVAVTVAVGNDSNASVSVGNGMNTVTVSDEERSTVTINGGNGGNAVTINTWDGGVLMCTADEGNGGDADAPVNNGPDGHQTYNVTLGSGTDHLTITPGGSDPSVFPGTVQDEGVDDVNQPPSYQANGEPDSMIAQNQTITVAMGDGGTALNPQTANIETGHDSTVTFTSGNGVEQTTILANNSIWTGGDDQLAQTGVGKSTIKVTSGNGDKTFNINTDNEGANGITNQILDNGSNISLVAGAGNDVVMIVAGTNATISETLNSVVGNVTHSTITIPDNTTPGFIGVGNVTVVTGAGQDNVVIHGSDGNKVNVSTGAGDDYVQIHSLGAGIVLDGGTDNGVFNGAGAVKPFTYSGGDTLATFDSAFASGLPVAGTVMNFENLQILDRMTNSIDTQNVGPNNEIHHVILAQGYSGNFVTLDGLDNAAEVDILNTAGGSGGGDSNLANNEILIPIAGAAIGKGDSVTLLLSSPQVGGNAYFGTVDLDPILIDPVEVLNLYSTGGAAMNFVKIEDPGLKTINMWDDPSTSINLNSSNFGDSVTTFNAHNFSQAIVFNMPGFGDQSVTFTATATGTGYLHNQAADMLKFGNGNDIVSVGNGANTLTFGHGSNTVTAGNGDNTVNLGTDTSHVDTVMLGSGANTVNFTGLGGTASTITFAPHSTSVIDTVYFSHGGNSAFGTPDIITGFNGSGHDILAFNDANIAGGDTTVHFFTATSDAGAAAIILGHAASTGATFVYNTTSGHLFVDGAGGDHGHLNSMDASDMEIALVGAPALTATDIHLV